MAKTKKQMVLAFFESEAAADAAVKEIKQWDKANEDVKLGAIGILVKDDKGKVKTHKLGKRKTGAGALLGALAVAITGGMSLAGGALVGGVVGAFIRQGMGLSKDDLARIGGSLDDGKAAVGVLAEPVEADSVKAKFVELGGVVETHEVTPETVEQIEEAVQATPEEPEETAA